MRPSLRWSRSLIGAQRLSASKVSAHTPSYQDDELHGSVLNAFRHQRFLHRAPFGTAQPASSNPPIGIKGRHRPGPRQDGLDVLNAFRHQRFLHSIRVTVCFYWPNSSPCHALPRICSEFPSEVKVEVHNALFFLGFISSKHFSLCLAYLSHWNYLQYPCFPSKGNCPVCNACRPWRFKRYRIAAEVQSTIFLPSVLQPCSGWRVGSREDHPPHPSPFPIDDGPVPSAPGSDDIGTGSTATAPRNHSRSCAPASIFWGRGYRN